MQQHDSHRRLLEDHAPHAANGTAKVHEPAAYDPDAAHENEQLIQDDPAPRHGGSPSAATPTTILVSSGTGFASPTMRISTAASSKGPHSRHGLSMRSAQDAAPHVWLLTHERGTATRVRKFAAVGELLDSLHVELRAIRDRSNAANAFPIASAHSSGISRRNRSSMIARNSTTTQSPQQQPQQVDGSDLAPNAPTRKPSQLVSARAPKSAATASTASSTSGTSSNSSGVELTVARWIDIQTDDPAVIEAIAATLPLHHTSVEALLSHDTVDRVEHFTSGSYASVTLGCVYLPPRAPHHGHAAKVAADPRSFVQDDKRERELVSVIIFSDLLLTIHKRPFRALGDVLTRIRNDFGSHNGGPSHTTGTPSPARRAGGGGSKHHHMMTPAWLLATLVDFAVINSMPLPASLLAHSHGLDERVIEASADGTHEDFLVLMRGIMRARRNVTKTSLDAACKDQLLVELMLPAARTGFVSRSAAAIETYKRCQFELADAALCIDRARDVLLQANNNLESIMSLKSSAQQRELEKQMHALAYVTAVAVPPSMIAGIMGMNVTVPFMIELITDSYAPFIVIVSVMGAWLFYWFPLALGVNPWRRLRQIICGAQQQEF